MEAKTGGQSKDKNGPAYFNKVFKGSEKKFGHRKPKRVIYKKILKNLFSVAKKSQRIYIEVL